MAGEISMDTSAYATVPAGAHASAQAVHNAASSLTAAHAAPNAGDPLSAEAAHVFTAATTQLGTAVSAVSTDTLEGLAQSALNFMRNVMHIDEDAQAVTNASVTEG